MIRKFYITIFLTIAVYACQKQPILDEPIIPPLTIDEAKKWDESTYGDVKLPKQKSDYPTKVVNTLLWDQALMSQKEDISAVGVAISSNLKRAYGPVPEGKVNSFPRLVIRRNMNSGKYQCRVMTLICDSVYMLLPDFESRMNRTGTFSMDNEFSGKVYFSRIDGRLFSGYRYVNGKCVATIRPVSGSSSTKINPADSCLKCRPERVRVVEYIKESK